MPDPRARLCQVDPPPRVAPATGSSRRWSPRRASVLGLADRVDAGGLEDEPGLAARASSSADRASASSSPCPHSAWTALPRLLRSLRYFHRMMSGRATDSQREACSAAARASSTSSVPDGKRPRSRIPVAAAEWATTTPGSRCSVGIITHSPCTWSNHRASVRSLATPFWAATTGTSGPAAATRARAAASVSWLFTARTTTSSAVQVSAAGSAYTGMRRVTRSSGVAKVSPRSRTASPWAPRATSATSYPLWWSRAPIVPADPPAPSTTIRIRPP